MSNLRVDRQLTEEEYDPTGFFAKERAWLEKFHLQNEQLFAQMRAEDILKSQQQEAAHQPKKETQPEPVLEPVLKSVPSSASDLERLSLERKIEWVLQPLVFLMRLRAEIEMEVEARVFQFRAEQFAAKNPQLLKKIRRVRNEAICASLLVLFLANGDNEVKFAQAALTFFQKLAKPGAINFYSPNATALPSPTPLFPPSSITPTMDAFLQPFESRKFATPQPFQTTHIVQSGETFYSIAERFGISVEHLQNYNLGIDPRSIPVGIRLTIPLQ